MVSLSSYTLSFLTLVDVKLNGDNYKEWLTIVRVILLELDSSHSYPTKQTCHSDM